LKKWQLLRFFILFLIMENNFPSMAVLYMIEIGAAHSGLSENKIDSITDLIKSNTVNHYG